ncbi:hypothetical protein ACFL2R_00470 [Patescibacteria group bacterium]
MNIILKKVYGDILSERLKGVYLFDDLLWLSDLEVNDLLIFLYFSIEVFSEEKILTKKFSNIHVLEVFADLFAKKCPLGDSLLWSTNDNAELTSLVSSKIGSGNKGVVGIFDFLDDERFANMEMNIQQGQFVVYTVFDLRTCIDVNIKVFPGVGVYQLFSFLNGGI